MNNKIILSVKIIPSDQNKLIGWSGNILMIGLNGNVNLDSVISFISTNFSISTDNINFLKNTGKIYIFELTTKHNELFEILTS